MKKQGIVAGVLLLAFAGIVQLSSAQTISRGTVAQIVDVAPSEPQLLQPEDVPLMGTFFMISDLQEDSAPPPYPFNPFSSAAVYSTAADGTFIVDDSEARPERFTATGNVNAAAARIWKHVSTLVQSVQTKQLARSSAMTLSATSSSTMLMAADSTGATLLMGSYTTDDLWFELISKTNDVGSFVIHPPAAEQGTGVYDLFMTTNLAANVPGLNATNWLWLLRTAPGQTNVAYSPLTDDTCFFQLAKTNDADGDFLSDAFEKLCSHTDPSNGDQNANGIPDGWEWMNFGSLQSANSDFDGDGYDNGLEYTNGTNPNTIVYQLTVTNQYVRTSWVPMFLGVSSGVPAKVAVLVDNTNTAAANWTGFTGSTPMVDLGGSQGWHTVRVGLRGWNAAYPPIWQQVDVKLDTVPPVLTITNPLPGTVTSQRFVQLLGLGSEPLKTVCFDVVNTNGAATNQSCNVTQQGFNTNTFEYTGSLFQGYDLELAGGVNTITVRASDLAGNVTATNFTVTLDVMSATNAPVVQVIWPQNGMQVAGESFTLRGRVNDPTAKVTAQIGFPDGTSSNLNAAVERDGLFWVQDVRLTNGVTSIALSATNGAGLPGTNALSISKSSFPLTFDYSDHDSGPITKVTGTIGDTNYTVTVNGTTATMDTNGNWTAYPVHYFGRGMQSVTVTASSNSGGSGSGGGSGGSGGGGSGGSGSGGGSGNTNTVTASAVWPSAQGVSLAEYHGSVTTRYNQEYNTFETETMDYSERWNQTSNGESYRSFQAHRTYVFSGVPSYDLNSSVTTYDWSDTDPVGTYLDKKKYAGHDFTFSGTLDELQDDAHIKAFPLTLWDRVSGTMFHSQAHGVHHQWDLNEPGYSVEVDVSAESRREYVVPGLGKSGGKALVDLYADVKRYGRASDEAVKQYSDPWFGAWQGDATPETVTVGGHPVDETMTAYTTAAPGGVVNASVTGPGHNGHESSAGARELKLHWYGTDLTGKTQSAIVGQLIELSCNWSDFPEGTQFEWTVPGYAVAGYSANVNAGILYTNIVKTNYAVSFYWVDGGGKDVQCTVRCKGETLTAKTTFGVSKPAPSFWAEVRSAVAADSNYHAYQYDLVNGTDEIIDQGLQPGPWLHFGVAANWTNVGIAFLMTGAPTNTMRGQYAVVQIVEDCHIKHNRKNSDGSVIGLQVDALGLDTRYPFGSGNPLIPMGWCYSSTARWPDSPGDSLLNVTWASLTESFATYLMFQPTLLQGNTIPVPIYRIRWNWSAITKANTNGGYTLVSSTPASPQGASTLDFPQWTNNVKPLTWKTNSIPFNEN